MDIDLELILLKGYQQCLADNGGRCRSRFLLSNLSAVVLAEEAVALLRCRLQLSVCSSMAEHDSTGCNPRGLFSSRVLNRILLE